MMWSRPFQGQFVIYRLGLAMINPRTKSEVSMFTLYKDMKHTNTHRQPFYSSLDFQDNPGDLVPDMKDSTKSKN